MDTPLPAWFAPPCGLHSTLVARARTAAAPGEALFVVGPVAGMAGLLHAALDQVSRCPTPPGHARRLVMLGLVGRSRDNVGAIDIARCARDIARVDEAVTLMGRAEAGLAIALAGTHGEAQRGAIAGFADDGGEELFRQFGLPPGAGRAALRRAMGPKRIALVTGAIPYARSGDVLLVAASPAGVPTAQHGPDAPCGPDAGPGALTTGEPTLAGAPELGWDLPDAAADLPRPWRDCAGFPAGAAAGPSGHEGRLVVHGAVRGACLRAPSLARARSDAAWHGRLCLAPGAPARPAVRVAGMVGREVAMVELRH